jgi:sterol desaturase/sphingolipid hydroxylase (fatty acid hydroxylase superfamily)
MENTTTVTTTAPVTEHRETYGTAKTENLRDSGWWRILLPLVVLGGSLALIAIPLIFLLPLLVKSFDASYAANVQGTPLTWLWIVMILLVLAVDTVIIRGLLKVFFTQAGNYR